ncbi:alpha/beta fold hydrolase [Nakamurella sp. GG22]
METLPESSVRRLGVSTGIGQVPVRLVGEGPPVLCVHGAFVDSHIFDATARLLAARATVVLPDLPQGAHRHAVPERNRLHPGGIADALADVLEAADLGPAVVVGNDNGGAMSQLLAAEYPDLVAGIVLAGCEVLEHFPPPAFAPFVAGAKWPQTLSGFARVLRIPAVLADPGPLNIFTVRGFGRDYVRRITTGILENPAVRADLAVFIRSLRPELLLRASSRLGYLQGHAEIVWPRRDLCFSAADGRRVAAMLDTRVVWADRAGTFVPVDRPDLVAAAAQRVLDIDPTGRPSSASQSRRPVL